MSKVVATAANAELLSFIGCLCCQQIDTQDANHLLLNFYVTLRCYIRSKNFIPQAQNLKLNLSDIVHFRVLFSLTWIVT